ncbi:MAG TPA: hypothetical protein VGH20_10795 [Myxococcales bacterium]|jgi:hypothetical protein
MKTPGNDPKQQGRGYIGVAVRQAIEFIEARGLTAKVRADASPAALAQIDKPPGMMAWQDAAVLDELETLLEKHGGRSACVDLGLHAARKLGSGIVAPVLKFALQLFGNSPATLLGNLDRFYSMVTKGLTYGYEAVGDKQGLVILTAEGPSIPRAFFDVTRGNLLYMLELTGTKGTVDAPKIRTTTDRSTVVEYRVGWE